MSLMWKMYMGNVICEYNNKSFCKMIKGNIIKGKKKSYVKFTAANIKFYPSN